MGNEARTSSGIIVPETQQPTQVGFSRRELFRRAGEVAAGAVGLYVANSLEPFVNMVDAAAARRIIRIESRQEAAGRYGYDYWSKDWRNWIKHKDGTVTLNQDPSGAVHRVRTNGAIIRGTIRPDPYTGKLIRFVARPHGVGYVDGNRMTFTLLPESQRDAEFNRQIASERKLAKSTEIVMPILQPHKIETARVESEQLWAYTSIQEAIDELATAADPYLLKKTSWRINEYGGVELTSDPTGAVHYLKAPANVVWDEWVRVKRIRSVNGQNEVLNDFQAIAFVGRPTPPNAYAEIPMTGGTAWRVPDPDERGISRAESARRLLVAQQLKWQVFRQLKERERGPVTKEPNGGQPGVLVLPVSN